MAVEVLTPIPAASVLLLRDAPLEVLMMLRHESSSFVPDAWVFPGGAVEDDDRALAQHEELNTMRYAAARELFEESGIWLGRPLRGVEAKRAALLAGETTFRDLLAEAPLDLEKLVWTSRWITPKGIPKRFDTYFFLATCGRDAVATVQESEAADIIWIPPGEAIERHLRREMKLVFPTLKNLEAIAGFGSAAELIDSRRDASIEAVEPVLIDGRPALR
jgi:8-oxo-dGTP pyrophosphatase MutT (NUDIX family)